MTQTDLTFVTLATSGKTTDQALTLGNSLREFGGALSDRPIWVIVPEGAKNFSTTRRDQFAELGVEVIPFEIEPEILEFPFAAKVLAAAHAEEAATGKTDLLTWLDADNLIFNEPSEFLLPPGKALGYRPVHHRLIGPAWDAPIDPFWRLVYQLFDIPAERLFPMTTHTGEHTKPYFNAGTFVIRPERHLLALWEWAFMDNSLIPAFQRYYEGNPIYAVFIHQVIFTAVLLSNLEWKEMTELSPRINYPLHLHHEIPESLQASEIDQLTTVRYEDIFEHADWRETLPVISPLHDWLEKQPILQQPPESDQD
jgi:hypothetical protein